MIDNVYTILSNNASVSSAATGGIWLEEVPQGKEPAYIALSIVDGDTNDSKTSTSKMDVYIISVSVYAQRLYDSGGVVGAVSLLELVRNALDGYEDTVNGQLMYCRAFSTPQTFNLSIPNKKLISAEMDYEIYATR